MVEFCAFKKVKTILYNKYLGTQIMKNIKAVSSTKASLAEENNN